MNFKKILKSNFWLWPIGCTYLLAVYALFGPFMNLIPFYISGKIPIEPGIISSLVGVSISIIGLFFLVFRSDLRILLVKGVYIFASVFSFLKFVVIIIATQDMKWLIEFVKIVFMVLSFFYLNSKSFIESLKEYEAKRKLKSV